MYRAPNPGQNEFPKESTSSPSGEERGEASPFFTVLIVGSVFFHLLSLGESSSPSQHAVHPIGQGRPSKYSVPLPYDRKPL